MCSLVHVRGFVKMAALADMGWMCERVHGQMCAWEEACKSKVCMCMCVGGCVHVCMRVWTCAWVDACMGGCMHEWMCAWMDMCMDGCVHGCAHGWIYACMDVSTGG